jgi:hypothetical protein
MIAELLEQALIKVGSGKALADTLDITPSELSRIRSGDVGMKLTKISKLIEVSGFTLVPADHDRRLKEALKTVSALWAEADK